ncbi:TniQ family protein [Brevibacillus laterosporus]|uniref:TniQ family protein n=1 Tax=Brevibacillus laterosporus TaxID=1465 RepID=UPI000839C03B|nr:TniQ family protein [Brevibacillus laterosporus]
MRICTRLLLIRPQIENDESIEGYRTRLAIENGYTENSLNSLLISKFNKEKNKMENTIFVLEEVTGTSLKNNSLYNLDYLNKKQVIIQNGLNQKISRYCPLCIKEKKYHRVQWFLAPVFICCKHDVILREKCMVCLKKTNVVEIVSDRCSNCKSKLSDNIAFRYKTEIGKKIEGVYWDTFFSDNPVWEELDLSRYFIMLKKISICLTTYFRNMLNVQYLTLSQKELWSVNDYREFIQVVSYAHYLLENWPYNFFKEKQRAYNVIPIISICLLSTPDKEVNNVLNKAMEELFRLIRYRIIH